MHKKVGKKTSNFVFKDKKTKQNFPLSRPPSPYNPKKKANVCQIKIVTRTLSRKKNSKVLFGLNL